ncbi:MAG: hypothetical protein ACRDV3_06570 [Acidothermaceae bacterium]
MSESAAAVDVARILQAWQRRRRIAFSSAFAVALVAIFFFGWYGFWLGLGLVLLVKVGFWVFPLINASYADQRADRIEPTIHDPE